MTSPEHGQAPYSLRFDWGLPGARALVADARPGDVAVVVDVLSFTTTLTLALERRIAVHPYPWRDDGASAYAAERDAVLAAGRREGLATGRVSLSPASMLDAGGVDRVVLPSPNGSSICFALADSGVIVIGASLRNAAAVGTWLLARATGRIAVVAAGERWPDGSLRPAVEDLWGAGAVLRAVGPAGASPEAAAAMRRTTWCAAGWRRAWPSARAVASCWPSASRVTWRWRPSGMRPASYRCSTATCSPTGLRTCSGGRPRW